MGVYEKDRTNVCFAEQRALSSYVIRMTIILIRPGNQATKDILYTTYIGTEETRNSEAWSHKEPFLTSKP